MINNHITVYKKKNYNMENNRNQKGQFIKGTHWRDKKLIWDRDWLYNEYVTKGKSMGEISKEINVTEAGVRYWIKKHEIPRRTTSESRKIKHWGLYGQDNPMWNKKGELNPNWKGGISQERQTYYQSIEWKEVCTEVWKRDSATCQRCGLHRDDNRDHPFHIHHIVSFKVIDKRSELDNLILLCETCHHWTHSKQNTEKLFIL